MLTFQEFSDLAQKGKLIPVTEKLAADMETPVTVLARLQEDENVFLLESVEAGKRFGRYSFIGLNPRGVFTVKDGKAFYAPAEGKSANLLRPKAPSWRSERS